MGPQWILVRPMGVYNITANVTYSDVFDVGDSVEVHGFLNVATVSGTSPSLTVTGQHSIDGNSWADVSGLAFAAAAAAGLEMKSASANMFRHVRFKYDLSGRASTVTFELQVCAKARA